MTGALSGRGISRSAECDLARGRFDMRQFHKQVGRRCRKPNRYVDKIWLLTRISERFLPQHNSPIDFGLKDSTRTHVLWALPLRKKIATILG